jgi:hypothetical protein
VNPTGVQGATTNPNAAVVGGGGGLTYPGTLPPYYMQINVQQYQRTSVLAPATLAGSQIIQLPLPENLLDETRVSYTEKENNALVGALYDAFSATRNQHGGQAAGGVTGIAKQMGGVAGVGALNTIIPGAGSAIAAGLGVAGNPYLIVEFQSSNFKQHTFNWIFSPDSPAESASLKAIIDVLRKFMLPNLLGGPGVFLGYPSVFLPMIVPNANQLYIFKHCVLDDVQVDYAMGGVPAFYTGTQAPARVRLTLHFLEIEIGLQETYGQTF